MELLAPETKRKISDPLGYPSNKRKKSSEITSSRWGNIEYPLNQKENHSNQITITELAVHSSLPGLSVTELSNNTPTEHTHIVHQAIGIFQDDIVIEILHRLPVRSLHRFKCISKYWKALISDPYFKKKHFNRAKNDQDSHKFLVSKRHIGQRCTLYSSSLSSAQIVVDEHKLDFPSSLKPWTSRLLCCCDGLVLLYAINKSSNGDILNLVLWNPSTRESIRLPLPQLPLKGYVCGLAHDATSDDYKILALNLNAPPDKVSGEFLALRNGSWRSWKHPPVIYHLKGAIMDSGVDFLAFLHGAFHWVGLKQRCSDHTIFSFGISNEVYGEIPLPEGMCYPTSIPKTRTEHGVSILDGMLCFRSTCYNRMGGTFKLWVMKDYGVKESWTPLFTIQDSNFCYSAIPIYRYADGEILLSLRHIVRLGSVYRTSRGPFELWPCEPPITMNGIIYTESLISPKLLA